MPYINDAEITTEPALTAKEAAPILKVHPSTLLKMAERNEIPWFPVGKRKRFLESALVAWRQSLQSGHHNHPRTA
jgi:excisionase family DNA binding protein